jgi:hypothetical protein
LPGCSRFTYPPEWELYDLETDPYELRNIYGEPAYATVREQLKARMWHAQKAVGDEARPSQPVPAGIAGRFAATPRASVDA